MAQVWDLPALEEGVSGTAKVSGKSSDLARLVPKLGQSLKRSPKEGPKSLKNRLSVFL